MAFGNDLGLAQSSTISAARAQLTNSGKLTSYVYSSVDASGNLIVQVSNYGYFSIAPTTVYVDGTQASNLVLLSMDGIPATLIATGTVTSLKITGASPFTSASGHAVVIVDTSGFSFEVRT